MPNPQLLQEDILPAPLPTIERRTYHRLRYDRRALNLPAARRVGAIEDVWEVRVERGAPKRVWFGFRYDARALATAIGHIGQMFGGRGRGGALIDGDPFAGLPTCFSEADAARIPEHRPTAGLLGGEGVQVRRFGATVKRRAPDGMIEEACYTRLMDAASATETRLRLLSSRYVDATPYLEED